MADTVATFIAQHVRPFLDDPNAKRFTADFVEGRILEAQNEIVRAIPHINPVTADMELVAGVVQTIPAAYFHILDIPCNGTQDSRGKAVRPVALKEMNELVPNWTEHAANAIVKNVVHDKSLGRSDFMVYPKQPISDQGSVVIVAGQLFFDHAGVGNDEMALPIECYQAISDKTLELCFSKVYGKDDAQAMKYKQSFIDSLAMLSAFSS